MQLYNLRLGKPLRYRSAGLASLDAALESAGASGDGSEFLLLWDWESAVDDGTDGPRARRPLPLPAFAGTLAPAGAPGEAEAGEGLEAGAWLFCQSRSGPGGPTAADVEDAVEWFARESWWTGAAASVKQAVRQVAEDGALAIQVLRRQAARS